MKSPADRNLLIFSFMLFTLYTEAGLLFISIVFIIVLFLKMLDMPVLPEKYDERTRRLLSVYGSPKSPGRTPVVNITST